jgi:hypothetical protein
LLGLLLGVLIIAVFSRKISMDCSLCADHASRRSKLMRLSIILALTSLPVAYAGAVYLTGPWAVPLILVGVLMALLAPLPLAWSPFFRVQAVRIDNEWATIKGFDERFLAQLPNRQSVDLPLGNFGNASQIRRGI